MNIRVLTAILGCFLVAGCKTLTVTDEPFFRTREMRDTLDAYLSRIDTTYSTTEYPLITYVIVDDMFEEHSPMLFIKTSHLTEIAYPSVGRSDTYTFKGVYRGHYMHLTFSTKYKQFFKRNLVQSPSVEEEYMFNARKLSQRNNNLCEGEAFYDILPNGSLNLSMYRESIYSYKYKGDGYSW